MLFDFDNGERISVNDKADLKICVCHVINAGGVVLITGARILSQKCKSAFAKIFGNFREQLLGDADIHGALSRREAETADGIGVRIGVRKIRLYIIYGRAVQKIGTCYVEEGAFRRVQIDACDSHGGKTDGIGTEGGSCGENAHALVAAETRGTNGGRPLLAHCFGKLPNEPEVRIAVEPAKGFGDAVFGLKDDGGACAIDKTALARNAEFLGKIVSDVCDDAHGGDFGHEFKNSFHIIIKGGDFFRLYHMVLLI